MKKRLLKLPDQELRALTDAVLRSSLHETVKIFFRDMGYNLTDVYAEADFQKRKVNKTLELLEYCGEEMHASAVFGEGERGGTDFTAAEEQGACDTLLDIMNRQGTKNDYASGMVPLVISPYGHMVCILGRTFYQNICVRDGWNEEAQRVDEPYAFTVLMPYLDPGEEGMGYEYDVCSRYGELRSFAEARQMYEAEEEEVREMFADNNKVLLNGIGSPDPVFRSFACYFGTDEAELSRSRELEVIYGEEAERLENAEEKYLQDHLKGKKQPR